MHGGDSGAIGWLGAQPLVAHVHMTPLLSVSMATIPGEHSQHVGRVL